MNKKTTLIILLAIAMFLSGCNIQTNTGIRSGTLKDDYIEEPLSKISRQYATALEVSNAILKKIKSKEFESIHTNFVDKSVKGVFTTNDLSTINTQVENLSGPIKNFKKSQWGFIAKQVKTDKFLYSIKIVEHEKGTFNYIFVFKDDGKYKKVVGIHIKHKKGVRQSNQI